MITVEHHSGTDSAEAVVDLDPAFPSAGIASTATAIRTKATATATHRDSAVIVADLEAANQPRWRHYVDNKPDAGVFHRLGWMRAVERAFGHKPWYLLASRGDRIVGVLPMFQIDSIVAGRFFVSVPYATYGGVLADDDQAAVALLERAREMLPRLGGRSLQLRSVHAADRGTGVEHSHVFFRKPLPDTREGVALAMPRKARAAARRAGETNDLTVEFGPAGLREVWRLYARSMRRLGSPNYPYRFFEEIQSALGDGCLVQLIRCDGRPAAGLLTLLDRDVIMPYFAGVDERRPLYGLNQYMYRRSMEWGVENGFRQYDFGRTRLDNRGSLDFKRLCGFEPRPLEYQTIVAPGRRSPGLSPSRPMWSAARSIWKHLPLLLTRPLGGWLAKSIPG